MKDTVIISNLEENPSKSEETLNLIEKEFNYSKENSFKVDFYPLFNKNNYKNCLILIDVISKSVIGHLGFTRRKFIIKGNEHLILLIGGVCIKTEYQGKGLSNILMDHALEINNDCALSCLWSDKLDYYRKKNFIPCVTLNETFVSIKDGVKLVQVPFGSLTSADKEQLSLLYEKSSNLQLYRDPTDWLNILQVNSARLFIERNDKKQIINYFIKDKGQDLTDVIHEYSSADIFSPKGSDKVLWSTQAFKESTTLYATLLKIQNIRLFNIFINDYTNQLISNVSILNKVNFENNGKQLSLEYDEFMQGIFGPGQFKELKDSLSIYFCGIDSI